MQVDLVKLLADYVIRHHYSHLLEGNYTLLPGGQYSLRVDHSVLQRAKRTHALALPLVPFNAVSCCIMNGEWVNNHMAPM